MICPGMPTKNSSHKFSGNIVRQKAASRLHISTEIMAKFNRGLPQMLLKIRRTIAVTGTA